MKNTAAALVRPKRERKRKEKRPFMCLSVTCPLAAPSGSVLLSPRRGCEAASQAAIAVITVQLIVAPVNISACYPGLGRKREESTRAFYSQSDTRSGEGRLSASGARRIGSEEAGWRRGGGRMMRGRSALSVIRVPVSVFNGG